MTEGATPAQELGREIQLWAVTNGLIDREAAGVPRGEAISQVFPGDNDEDECLNILHQRGISFIGYSEELASVTIYTERKPTKAQIQSLSDAFDRDGIQVLSKQGGQGVIKGDPPAPLGVNPAVLHNGRYTCGSSIHVTNPVGAGTLGCLVQSSDGTMYGLTNNHVSAMCSFAEQNLPILAPGSIDVRPGQVDPFTIGHHAKVLPMADGTPNNVNVAENSDAAIFKIRDRGLVTSMQRSTYDTPSKVATLRTGMTVEKVGRTTGHTTGRVTARPVSPQPIGYTGNRIIYFDELYVVESAAGPFATMGDSGSLVTSIGNDGERYAVGLVCAEDARNALTFVLPLKSILDRLGVTLVCQHNT